LLGCVWLYSVAAADSPQWYYSYEEALKTAARQGKPVMAFFYTTWCVWCRKLDEVAYADRSVINASRDFVCLRVDADRNREIAYGYGAARLPAIFFLDPSGRLIWREFGYREPDFLAGRMREVLAFFRKSRATEPYIKKAFEEAGRGRMDEAVSILSGAITAYPDDPRLYAARSSLYRYKKDLNAALDDLDRSLSLNPSDDGVLTMRGMVYYEKRDLPTALEDYKKAISINRWNYEAYNGRGLIYLEQNDLDSAIKNFNTTLLINPRHANAYFHRGIAYLKKGVLDKAISDFDMAIAINPNMMNAYSNRASACMHAGLYDKAWDDVRFIESRGYSLNSSFMDELKRLSGRER
ncbi:MAG: tetratricopeptide repeat protein, partial [Candidatus Omnitrophica bacterium]|nr:tetratricopeptide repeat protein [Candidatus Omnitrophota bacterium]